MDKYSDDLRCGIILEEVRGEIGEWNNCEWIEEQQDPHTFVLETKGLIQTYEYKHRYESLYDITDEVRNPVGSETGTGNSLYMLELLLTLFYDQ